ncbi:GPW/gp25 family protein [Selenomonas dianae]|uniref:IraD/Gp25-like domain-containing protein n=1 Tax=Selenomonas dianae TaxID=135079 RepID=A0ABN0SY26_9FIRM|nr:GPW/gp25 family protein [Selenomonas dianae]WLD81408.1 GPW/gp25 family protein [Selenomonas dianae]
MTYEISGGETPPFNLAPATIAEEVLQNVRMIISTIKYSVPMDREFGIDGAVIDRPVNVAKAHLSNEIFRAVRRYEPRAVIESIDFDGDESGRLTPRIKVQINE